MRQFTIALVTCLLCVLGAAAARANRGINCELWRGLPVYADGRQKPLDSLARETLRSITQNENVHDSTSDEELDPVAAYLSMLLDWRGWEHANRGQLRLVSDWHPLYFHLHEPDHWDRLPLLPVQSPDLGFVLGLGKDANHISPYELATKTVEEPRSDRRIPFPTWAQNLVILEQSGEALTDLEVNAVELAHRLWLYQDHRMGRGLEISPRESQQVTRRLSVAELLVTEFDAESDPTGELRKCQSSLLNVRKQFQQQDNAAFARASGEFWLKLEGDPTEAEVYGNGWSIQLELVYNRWVPFRWGWACLLASAIGLGVHFASRWWSVYASSLATYLGGLLAVVIGFGLRIAVAGRPPGTNLFESVICVGAGVAVLGLLLARVHRSKLILAVAASVAALLIAVADNYPLVLDPAIRPLEPVLRSDFWLVAHIITVMLSYSAFALSLGLANVTFGYFFFSSPKQRAVRPLCRWTIDLIQLGVVLLAAGIVLGAIWADRVWGRLWSWDPKEVWALVALLSYAALLYARHAGWTGHRGLAVSVVACSCLLVMAWYGVHFAQSSGLHRYGATNGGQSYVCAAIILQWTVVGSSLLRSWYRDAEGDTVWRTAVGLPGPEDGVSPT